MSGWTQAGPRLAQATGRARGGSGRTQLAGKRAPASPRCSAAQLPRWLPHTRLEPPAPQLHLPAACGTLPCRAIQRRAQRPLEQAVRVPSGRRHCAGAADGAHQTVPAADVRDSQRKKPRRRNPPSAAPAAASAWIFAVYSASSLHSVGPARGRFAHVGCGSVRLARQPAARAAAVVRGRRVHGRQSPGGAGPGARRQQPGRRGPANTRQARPLTEVVLNGQPVEVDDALLSLGRAGDALLLSNPLRPQLFRQREHRPELLPGVADPVQVVELCQRADVLNVGVILEGVALELQTRDRNHHHHPPNPNNAEQAQQGVSSVDSKRSSLGQARPCEDVGSTALPAPLHQQKPELIPISRAGTGKSEPACLGACVPRRKRGVGSSPTGWARWPKGPCRPSALTTFWHLCTSANATPSSSSSESLLASASVFVSMLPFWRVQVLRCGRCITSR